MLSCHIKSYLGLKNECVGWKKRKWLNLKCSVVGLLFVSFLGRRRTIIRASRPDGFRYLPHGLFAKKVIKLVEKGDDTIVAFELVVKFLETAHILYDVKLLPSLAKVDTAVTQSVRIADVNEGQVLQDKADIRYARRLRLSQRLPVSSKGRRTIDQSAIFLNISKRK